MEKLDLHGKTGFIIGGTRGIGNAIAMRMACLGMNLTVIARKEDELAAMKAQVEPLGVRFLGIQASNTDFDAIAAAFKTSWQTYGRLDLLVNAAGTGVMTPFEELTKSDVDTTIDVNLKGTIYAVKLFRTLKKPAAATFSIFPPCPPSAAFPIPSITTAFIPQQSLPSTALPSACRNTCSSMASA